MKILLMLLAFACTFSAAAQDPDETAIRQLLDKQTKAWNQGNLEGFMDGYWEHDSLMFVGKSGVTYGWKNTLNNYKKGYPDTASMGKLHFNILKVSRISPDYFFVAGKWHLARSIGDLQGHYTLVLRRISGKWVIISDHSS
jgi:uncharacterized protein (TIGR02246 family)